LATACVLLFVKPASRKLPEHPLTLKDWVLAEKDLVATMEAEGVEA
jgi:hypothetical protein